MKLRDLVAGIATVQRPAAPGAAANSVDSAAPPSPDITKITDDSRKVTPGCMFVARPGTKADGRAFVADAIARGAVAVLFDDSDGSGDPCPIESTVLRVRVNPRQGGAVTADGTSAPAASARAAAPVALAAFRMAERLEGEPSEWLSLVGITGTNGKTTMAFLLQQFVRAAGNACGVIGTVVVDDGRTAEPAELTTPNGIDISAALCRMVLNGCRTCAMEVSSHALDQGRTSAVRFRVGIFSNLTGDHLDYHETMENYAAAKARLFETLPKAGAAIVNADDPWWERMVKDCRARVWRCKVEAESAPSVDAASAASTASAADEGVAALAPDAGARRGPVTRYGFPGPPPDLCTATIHACRLGWQDTTFAGPFGRVRVKLPLVGPHNAMNALQAATAAWCIGVPPAAISQALAACTAPPGRLEPVTTPADHFAVLVDYAHTDDALLNVLTTLRPLVGEGGRLTVVFGCGGDRDRTKRPRMMHVACMHADRVIVTSDNPRTEDPEAIIDEVLKGRTGAVCARMENATPDPNAPRATSIQRQADRKRAIELAVNEANPGDIVLIAGKGHEDYQIFGREKRPFDDRLIALAALGRGAPEPSRNAAQAEAAAR